MMRPHGYREPSRVDEVAQFLMNNTIAFSYSSALVWKRKLYDFLFYSNVTIHVIEGISSSFQK